MFQKIARAGAVLAVLFAVFVGIAAPAVADEDGIPPVFVGGRLVASAAILDHGRLFVPVRGIFETLDARVAYSPPRIVVVRKDGVVVAGLVVDRRHAVVGNRPRMLAAAPIRRADRVYVPLRVIAEILGATVVYSRVPRLIDVRVPGGRLAAAPAAPVPATDVPEEATIVPLWAMVLVGLLVLVFTLECLRRLAGMLVGRRRVSAPRGLEIANAAATGNQYAIGNTAE